MSANPDQPGVPDHAPQTPLPQGVAPQSSLSPEKPRPLSGFRLLFTLCTLALLAVCLIFSWMTRDSMAGQSFLRANHDSQSPLVDLRPWGTAQTLAPLAVSSEEISFSRDAERLADHEVDQAFASALRLAGLQSGTRKLSGHALALSQKAAALRQTVQQDQAYLDSLNEAAKSVRNAPSSDDIDVAKAQLGLDQDELADAERDLARASGDQRTSIQQELTAHEAQMAKYDGHANQQGQPAAASSQDYATLLQRIEAWSSQRSRDKLIRQAMHQSQAAAKALTAEHDKLEAQASASMTAAAAALQPTAEGRLAALKLRSEQGRILAVYDDRIETEQQLADVYAKWSAQVALEHHIALHLVLVSLALIAFIVLAVVLIDTAVRDLLSRPTLDRRRAQTLRTIVELCIQLVGLIMVLLVLFGVPQQMPTILGLATAGFTFVMQPFILAFVGWFVLMGKNGIRVGDWVEINGVGGEVVEIGLFRTAMLETGNWTDKGHPTGRRVTFINNFAISGQYFNFSTTGQWMWDEIKVSIPFAPDISVTIEAIHKAVLMETDKDARQAEAEWKRATGKNTMSQFSAVPAVDMRPAASGIDLIIRYVTRATDRYDMRNRLFERIITLLQKPKQIEEGADKASVS